MATSSGIVGLVQRALGRDDLGGRRFGAQADLQAGRDRGLALRRSRRDQILVDHVLKLQAQLAKAGGRGVGQVVGDRVQIHLLRAHAAGGCVQGSNHGFLLVLDSHPRQIFGGNLVELGVEDGERLLHHLRLALHDDQVERSLDHILVGGLEGSLVDRGILRRQWAGRRRRNVAVGALGGQLGAGGKVKTPTVATTPPATESAPSAPTVTSPGGTGMGLPAEDSTGSPAEVTSCPFGAR